MRRQGGLRHRCHSRYTRLSGRGVAQPGSASVWGTGGRRFKSCRPDQFSPLPLIDVAMNARRAFAFIFCTVTLDVLALGLMIPVLPQHRAGLHGRRHRRRRQGVRRVRHRLGADAVPLLAAAGRRCRDRYGRRPVILISCLGLGLDYVFMALAPSLTLLFIGRIISGITAATIGTGFAYIADVTPPEDRAKRLRHRRRGVRPGLRGRPGARRPAGRPRSAPAVLGVGRGLPGQCRLRLVRAARIAAAGAAHGLRLEARQSGRLAAPARLASRAVGPGGRSTSSANSRIRCCRRCSCSMPPIATAGARRPSA